MLAVEAVARLAVPTFVLDAEGRVLLGNEACAKLTGIRADTVIGTKEHWRGFYAHQRPCLADLVFSSDGTGSNLYAAGGSSATDGRRHAENWCDLPAGGRRYLAIDAGPILDPDGKILAVVETLQDLTALKEAQGDVERAKEEQVGRLETVRKALGAALDRLARGDLMSRVTEPLPDAVDALRTDFNTAADELQGVLVTLVDTIEAIRTSIGEIGHATEDLSRRTGQQASSLEGTASSLDEITATVAQTAASAGQARQAVTAARDEAEKGGTIARDAMSAMSGIAASSGQIGQIISVIDEIAFQTNLLALNAGVEAARAGEAGRGFAVVAQEVRSLAQRSAEAAKEIKGLVSAANSQVQQGVALVERTGQALERIVAEVAPLATVVSEIAGTAEQQSERLSRVNESLRSVDQATQKNAAMVQQSTAAIRSLAELTDELSAVVERFEIGAESTAPARSPTFRRAA